MLIVRLLQCGIKICVSLIFLCRRYYISLYQIIKGKYMLYIVNNKKMFQIRNNTVSNLHHLYIYIMVLIRKTKSFGKWLFNHQKDNNTEENEDDIILFIPHNGIIGYSKGNIFQMEESKFNTKDFYPKISKWYVKFNRCIYYYIEWIKNNGRIFLIHPFYHHTDKYQIGMKVNQKPKTIIPSHIVKWIDDG